MITEAQRAKIRDQLQLRAAAMAKVKKGPRHLKVPPRQPWPSALERRYARAVMVPIRDIQASVEKTLVPALPHILEAAAAERGQAARQDGDYVDIVRGLLGTLTVQFFGTWTDDSLTPIALSYARELSDLNKKRLSDAFQKVLGADIFKAEPWLAAEIKAFTTQNVEQMKSIARQHFTRLENIIYDGVRLGYSSSQMAQDILTAPLKASKAKAEGLARDQLGTLGSQLSLLRQTAEGIIRYRWRGMLDGKERQDHAQREGKIFEWVSPPDGGPPGMPRKCRCYAEPVFDDVAGEFIGDVD